MSQFDPTFEEDPLASGVFELDWEVFGELCRALALRVYRGYDPEVVVGIATAGVIPGAVIADILQIDFYSLKISRRSGGQLVRDQPELLTAAPVAAAGKRVLLVDEITTSGETMRVALAALRDVVPQEIRTSACFARPNGYQPDYFALSTDDTIVFPWNRSVIRDGELVLNEIYRGKIRDV